MLYIRLTKSKLITSIKVNHYKIEFGKDHEGVEMMTITTDCNDGKRRSLTLYKEELEFLEYMLALKRQKKGAKK